MLNSQVVSNFTTLNHTTKFVTKLCKKKKKKGANLTLTGMEKKKEKKLEMNKVNEKKKHNIT